MSADKPLSVRLAVSYERALEMTRSALMDEGFGVLTEIDVQRTLKEKIGASFRKYTILGTCNPSMAFVGLQRDLQLGLFLPCNVVVYEEDGGSVVIVQDPTEMLAVAGNPELKEVAEIARSHLERVVEALRAQKAS